MGLITIATAMAAIDNTPVSMTITLKNGNTVSYAASNMDSVRFVGGKFGDNGAIGMKIYLKGQTQSIDYLYSQITNVVEDTQPVVSSDIFTRITDVSQLEAGKRYIIVYEGGNMTMSGITGKETITITNNSTTLEDNTAADIFTLGGSTDAWTLYNEGKYLYSFSGTSLSTSLDSNVATWKMSFDNNNAVIQSNAGDKRYIVAYGTTNFRAYASLTQSGANRIQLYKEDDGSAASVVAAPTFSPAGGTYTSAQNVTISTTTSGATIYYTTDGSTPSSHSTAYTTPIPVSGNMTIKAIAVKGDVLSTVVTATYIIGSSANNVNANWNIAGSGIPQSKADPTFTNKSTDEYAWRLEYPHINTASDNQRVVKAVSTYGITYSLEWDNNKIANRWTCYTMCAKNNATNVGRKDAFKADDAVTVSPSDSYTNSSTYSRGHLCPSADRVASRDQNSQTFYMTNMQPQYQNHNGGVWATLEGYVRSKWQPTNNTDTLYVVKAATIANVTLNNTLSTGIITNTTDGAGHTLVVPKYFYMAFLYYDKSANSYKAFALWTEHLNGNNPSAATVISNRISIDELERRTGIDFFCNLPDDIEATVEATASYWDFSGN